LGIDVPGTLVAGATVGTVLFVDAENSREAGADVSGVAAGGGPAGALPSVPFRSNPRATRKVPLDCSMLMGLVNTRLAPMRKALATPAWPYTTATAKDAWFELELRALLNINVAFCSFSQSTTRASKRCAISFLTAAKGS